ncbi:MAG: adenylate/guanylate cyclase domain-containing protein [Arcobacteraceae bacterium]
MIGIILLVWHFKVEPFYKFSLQVNDIKYLFNENKPSSDVVFVAVDEKSVTQFGRWPWDREFLAKNLEKLQLAKSVAFDMVFSEPTLKQKDSALASSIENLDNTICGIFLRNDSTKIFTQENEEVLQESSLHRIFVEKLPFMQFKSAEVNIMEISSRCVFNGVFSTIADEDSLFRRYPIGFLYNHYVYPSLGIQLLRYVMNKDISIEQNNQNYHIEFDDKLIGIDKKGFVRLNYYQLSDYKIISFADLVKNDFDINKIKNKIVILGISEAGISDIRATPLGQIPGPLLHYTFISNFLQDILISDNYFLEFALIVFFSSIPIVLSSLIHSLNYRITFYVGILFFIIVFSIFMYVKYNIWIDMFYIILGYLTLLLFNGVFIFKTKELEAKFLKSAFENYLSGNLLDELISNPNKLKLGGESKEVTIIFTDIRGFTNLSETVSSENLIKILELYFTPMTRIVLTNSGTLDKYIGDAIMAFYNAPIDVPNHPKCAVDTALQMVDELDNINTTLKSFNLPSLNFGVGINTGNVIVGNIGSVNRFDYSVVGDSVNVASRIEGLSKVYKVQILITEFTKKGLDESYMIREIDTVKVRGKKEGIKIFQVMKKTQKNQQIKNLYEQALGNYKKQNLETAKKMFERCFTDYCDETSNVFLEKHF